MRIGTPQNVENTENHQYKIIAVDDEQGIVDSLSIFLKSAVILFDRTFLLSDFLFRSKPIMQISPPMPVPPHLHGEFL